MSTCHPVSSRLLGLVVLAVCIVAAPAEADVIVVDISGGGDFTNLQLAIDAAADGDILVVEAGYHAATSLWLTIDDKALTIVARPAGSVTTGPVLVQNLAAGKSVVLRGLVMQPFPITPFLGGTFAAVNNAGRILVEDCEIPGLDGGPGLLGSSASPGFIGAKVMASTVALQRTVVTGGRGVSTFQGGPFAQTASSPGATAIVVVNADVFLSDVTATGGDGGADGIFDNPGRAGGHGLHATDSRVVVAGSVFTGGDAGPGTTPGTAGTGAVSTGAAALLRELDSAYDGGAPDEIDLAIEGGAHQVWPGEAWTLVLPAPVVSGEVGVIEAHGPANRLFGLFFSFGLGYQPVANFKGVFLSGAPFFGPVVMATTDGSGDFAAPFVAPSLVGFGIEGLLNVDQAIMAQGEVGNVLSSGSVYVQVEPY